MGETLEIVYGPAPSDRESLNTDEEETESGGISFAEK